MRKAPLRHDMHLLLGEASFARHMAANAEASVGCKGRRRPERPPCPPVDICPCGIPSEAAPFTVVKWW